MVNVDLPEAVWQYLRWNAYLSENHKLLYISTPKVACTSLKWWFAALEGYSKALSEVKDNLESDPELVVHHSFHKVAPHIAGLGPQELAPALVSEGYFRFAVVRNPYKRIFSAWQSKLLLREPLQIPPYVNYEFFKRPIESAADIQASFEGFLEHLATNEAPRYLDHHWTPQADLLRPDLINYTKLAQIENVKELSEALSGHLGSGIPNPFTSRRTNESLLRFSHEFITERAAALMQVLYAQDFDTFGYDRTLPTSDKEYSTSEMNMAIRSISLIRGRHQTIMNTRLLFNESQEEVSELSEDVANLTREISELTDELSAEINHLNRQLVDRDAHIAGLQGDLNFLSATLRNIYASKGWRSLAPLRWLRRQQIRAGQLIRKLFLLLFHPGDALDLLRRALNIWRKDGWAGIKSSIRSYTDPNSNAEPVPNEPFDFQISPENYNPRVSVIVPNFNHNVYLEERLRSIYEQTYQNFEVILLDDCSTDNSVSLLKKYAALYPEKTRLYLNERNSGSPFSQWEKGILLAEGDLIWIAESDDFCEQDFLEKLVPLFSNDTVLLSYAHNIFVNQKGRRLPSAFENYVSAIHPHKWRTSYIETAHNEVNSALGLLNTLPNVSGVLFRKLDSHFPLFHNPAWKKMRVCGDWLFYLYLIRGGKIAYSRSTHNYYRIYESSTSKKTHSQDIYYQEHEQVAAAVAHLYKIPEKLLVRLQARLKDFYFKNVEHGSPEKFDSLFDLNEITRCMQERKPNVLMAAYGLAFGGGEIFPIRLANALHKAGSAVTLFNGGYEPTQLGVREMLSPQIAVVTNSSALNVNDLLVSFGIEVIHSHHASMENYFAVTKARRVPGVKHVATMHGMYEMMEDFMQNTKSIQASVDHWVYTAEKNILPFMKKGLFDTKKFTKIENGLPSPNFHKVDLSSLGITPDSFTACLASRALPDKGWMEAIEATQKARESTNKDIHLLLIGEGPVYNRLKEENLPEFIHLLGYRADLDDYLASVQLGLLPSYFQGESFPLVMIEFFMAEIPVIASNIGEISRMIKIDDHKIGGSLIELHNGKVDSDELAEAMIKMITNRDFYQDCIAGARLLKTRFDIDTIAQQYLAVYKRILKEEL
jgi:glycosyltransferase involved in cell wall biosynthesis